MIIILLAPSTDMFDSLMKANLAPQSSSTKSNWYVSDENNFSIC